MLHSYIFDQIAEERHYQINERGFNAEWDDQYDDGQLAIAASIFAIPPSARQKWSQGVDIYEMYRNTAIKSIGWDLHWFESDSYRKSLIKAAALIVAELERLDRLEQRWLVPKVNS